jgi:hypothetical protein
VSIWVARRLGLLADEFCPDELERSRAQLSAGYDGRAGAKPSNREVLDAMWLACASCGNERDRGGAGAMSEKSEVADAYEAARPQVQEAK